MTWSDAVDLVWSMFPALVITLLVTAILLLIGWLAMVEGLQGSDFLVLHVYEVFFQGKDIADRELSIWRIVFGIAVTFTGVLFWMGAMLTIFAKTVGDVLELLPALLPEDKSPGGTEAIDEAIDVQANGADT